MLTCCKEDNIIQLNVKGHLP